MQLSKKNPDVAKEKIHDVAELMDVMMCQKKDQYHDAACISGKCPSCENKGD